MSENKKLDYTKNGVVIDENGEAFIVAMRDSGECDWYMANRICNLPLKWQVELMFKYKDSLNKALRIFGGAPLEDIAGKNPWYWTIESCDSYHAWLISMINGTITHHDKTFTNRTRAVATVSVVSAM